MSEQMASSDGSGGVEIGLRQFDPSWIKPNSTVLIIAKRGSGKSTLMSDLLYYQRNKVGAAVVFSETEVMNFHYSNIIPPSFIYDKIDDLAIANVQKRQLTVKQSPPNSPNFNPNLIMIIDDCFADKGPFAQSNQLRGAVLNGRHWPVGVWVNAQYPNDVPKAIRTQIDFVFALACNQATTQKILFENFFSIFQTLPTFATALQTYTNNYGCLVLNNTEQSTDITKSVFWYRANPNQPPWRLGEDMWRYHDMYGLKSNRLTGRVDWNSPQTIASGSSSTAQEVLNRKRNKKGDTNLSFKFLDLNGKALDKARG